VSAPTERLHQRARAIRARAAIQRWEIRQRKHAAGCWFALERLFALSRRAWVLSERDTDALVAAGHEPDPADWLSSHRGGSSSSARARFHRSPAAKSSSCFRRASARAGDRASPL
jgi:hypothetical protein